MLVHQHQSGSRYADPLWQLPTLLQWWRFAEVQRVLSATLERLESNDLLVLDSAALSAGVLQTLKFLPQLAGLPQMQQQLGFLALGLVTSVAVRAAEKPASVFKHYRGFFLQAVPLVAIAWHPGSALADQHIDHNRFALRLCAVLAEKEPSLRHCLTEVAANCIVSPSAQSWGFWFARFFASNMQGALAIFAHGSTAEHGAAARVMESLLRQCHRRYSLELLERVLLFLEAWASSVTPLKGSYPHDWLCCAEGLLRGAESVGLTPAACFVAFFLDSLGASGGTAELQCRLPLTVAWIRDGLRARQASGAQEELVLRGYVASKAAEVMGGSHGSLKEDPTDWWHGPAEALRALICDVLVPGYLLDHSPSELEAHRASPICRALPHVIKTFALCPARFAEAEQVSLVIRPLEDLGHAWAERWCGLAENLRDDPTRQFFCSAVFLLVVSVLRQADLERICPMALLHCVRALAQVDLFRGLVQDTWEHRALCLHIMELGAENKDFISALLEALVEFNGCVSVPPSVDSGVDMGRDADVTGHEGVSRSGRFGLLARLLFLLGVVASPKVIDADCFFPLAWPVIVNVVLAMSGGDEDWTFVALRAHALACLSFQRAGTSGRSAEVKSYFAASALALASSPGEDACRAFLHTTRAVAQDMASRCDGDEGKDAAEAQELQLWVLRTISSRVLELLQEDSVDAAEGLFKVFCGATCYVDPSVLPETVYEHCRLRAVLIAHPPLCEVWLTFLIASFPEMSKELLTLRLLGDFPQAAAAYFPASGAEVARNRPWRSAL